MKPGDKVKLKAAATDLDAVIDSIDKNNGGLRLRVGGHIWFIPKTDIAKRVIIEADDSPLFGEGLE